MPYSFDDPIIEKRYVTSRDGEQILCDVVVGWRTVERPYADRKPQISWPQKSDAVTVILRSSESLLRQAPPDIAGRQGANLMAERNRSRTAVQSESLKAGSASFQADNEPNQTQEGNTQVATQTVTPTTPVTPVTPIAVNGPIPLTVAPAATPEPAKDWSRISSYKNMNVDVREMQELQKGQTKSWHVFIEHEGKVHDVSISEEMFNSVWDGYAANFVAFKEAGNDPRDFRGTLGVISAGRGRAVKFRNPFSEQELNQIANGGATTSGATVLRSVTGYTPPPVQK